ncbi:S-methyl-5-thioribose-1-phosphate isomerase, partial [Yersinia enterocolitica]|nr:S-methyl-5-thioribose-1-phosphate isomerase [Yersinia enterocolitica]
MQTLNTLDLQTTSLKIVDGKLWILDQQTLPQRQEWLSADTVELLIEHIQALRVRGAPLIGLSASLLLALLAERGLPQAQLEQALIALRESRPTAVNLMNNLARMQQALLQANWVAAMPHEALRLVEEDRELCEQIAQHGVQLVKPGSNLLTHCNTGGLATAGIGTAIGVLLKAHQQGKIKQVWVDETRPLLQ